MFYDNLHKLGIINFNDNSEDNTEEIIENIKIFQNSFYSTKGMACVKLHKAQKNQKVNI